LKLGANEHLNINDKEHLKKVQGTLDYVFCTANAKGMDWGLYLGLCALEAKFVLLAVPEEPISFPAGALIFKQVSMCGSLIGSAKEIQEMLAFAAANQVKPMVEILPVKEANKGYEKVHTNNVRYRVVLKQ